MRLLKLHGSVDWYISQNTRDIAKLASDVEKSSRAIKQREKFEEIIIYPGDEEDFREPPLKDILEECKRLFSRKLNVIVIGYSFRDEKIDQLFGCCEEGSKMFLLDPNAYEIKDRKEDKFGFSTITAIPQNFYENSLSCLTESIKRTLK